jgi:hypothetical protein
MKKHHSFKHPWSAPDMPPLHRELPAMVKVLSEHREAEQMQDRCHRCTKSHTDMGSSQHLPNFTSLHVVGTTRTCTC